MAAGCRNRALITYGYIERNQRKLRAGCSLVPFIVKCHCPGSAMRVTPTKILEISYQVG